MAEVYIDPSSGKQIGGKFGKLLARQTGRGMSVIETDVQKAKRKLTGGGGGGSRSKASTPTYYTSDLLEKSFKSKSAMQKAEQEYKQRQEQQRKQREKEKRERQKRIQSGKISRQLEGRQKEIGLPDSKRSYGEDYYRRGFVGSWKESMKRGYKNVGEFFFGKSHKYESVIEPFKWSEKKKYEKVPKAPKAAALIVGSMEAKRDPLGFIKGKEYEKVGEKLKDDTTFGEIQRDIEEKRSREIEQAGTRAEKRVEKVTSKWQGKVDRGEIGLEEARRKAEQEAEKINVEYKKKQEQAYKKYSDIPGVYERTGGVRGAIKTGTDIGVVGLGIGVSAAGSPVAGASITTGYFLGKGAYQSVKKPTYKEIKQQGGLFAGIEKTDKGKLELIKPTKLDVEYKQMRREGAINLAIGATSAYGIVRGAETELLKGELGKLGEQKIGVKSIQYAGPEKSKVKIKGIQKSGQLQREFDIIGDVYPQGKKGFIMPSGKGYSTTAGRFETPVYRGASPTYYAGGDVFQVGVKGQALQVKGGEIAIGKSLLEPTASFGMPFKEFSAKTGKQLGKTLKIRKDVYISPFATASKRVGVDRQGAEYYKFVGGKLDPTLTTPELKQFGISKVVKAPDLGGKGAGWTSFQGGRGTITKSATQLKGPSATLEQASKAVTEAQIKQFPSAKPLAATTFPTLRTQSTREEIQKQKGLQLSAPKEITKRKTSQISYQPSAIRGRLSQRGLLASTSSTKQISKTATTQKDILGIRERKVQKPLLKQPQLTTQTSPPSYPPLTGFGGFGFPGFPGLPPYKPQLGKGKPKEPQLFKQPESYQPSLTASVAGIRGKPQKLGKYGYNPFQIRGLENSKKTALMRKKQQSIKRKQQEINFYNPFHKNKKKKKVKII